MKITKTAIGNHLRRSPNGDVGMYRNGFKDGVNWTLQKAQAQAADCGCIDQRDCTGECMKKAQTAKPGDIRALKHRIHELEGEVIGYKQILDGQATPPQHQAAMEALRKANIDCVNHFDAIKEDYDKAQAAMKLALDALQLSRDDVEFCLAENLQLAGYERYDKRIAFYKEQLIKHDAAIAALEGVL